VVPCIALYYAIEYLAIEWLGTWDSLNFTGIPFPIHFFYVVGSQSFEHVGVGGGPVRVSTGEHEGYSYKKKKQKKNLATAMCPVLKH